MTLEFGLDTFLPVTVDETGQPVGGDQAVRNAVEEAVLAEAGLLIPDENDEEASGAVREDEVEKFKEFLDSVSPDDFKAT